MTLQRLKEKDAWDIYFTLLNYSVGVEALAQEVARHLSEGLVQEGLRKIGEKLASPTTWVRSSWRTSRRSVARRNERCECVTPLNVSVICCSSWGYRSRSRKPGGQVRRRSAQQNRIRGVLRLK